VHNGGRDVGDDRAVGTGVGRRGLALRTAPLVALVASLVPALVECGLDEESLGAACVKGEDCLSGFCSDQVCVAAPPALDGEPPLQEDAAIEASGEAATDAAPPRPDARPEASVEAASADVTDGPKDAAGDHATSDVIAKDGAKGSEG
jgi:hypothetical protein